MESGNDTDERREPEFRREMAYRLAWSVVSHSTFVSRGLAVVLRLFTYGRCAPRMSRTREWLLGWCAPHRPKPTRVTPSASSAPWCGRCAVPVRGRRCVCDCVWHLSFARKSEPMYFTTLLPGLRLYRAYRCRTRSNYNLSTFTPNPKPKRQVQLQALPSTRSALDSDMCLTPPVTCPVKL